MKRCCNYTDYLIKNAQAQNFDDNIAYRTGFESISYREFFQFVNRSSHFLENQYLSRSDRVLLIMNDSISLASFFLGAVQAGFIPVILNTMVGKDKLRFFVEDSQAKLVIADELNYEKATFAASGLNFSICCDSATENNYKKVLAPYPTEYTANQYTPEAPAFWQYTSGTTGKPKAVIHNHAAPVEIFKNYALDVIKIKESDRILSTTRMFFGYGLGNSLFFPLMAGATTWLQNGPITPSAVSTIINNFSPTLLFSSPTFYEILINTDDFCDGTDTSSIRLAISAGESLPEVTYNKWLDRKGVSILDGLGSTEALHIFISNRPDSVRPGSCGKPLNGVSVQLKMTGETHGNSQFGNLLVQTKAISNGYWNRNEETEKTFADGWLDTNDMVEIDKDGYLMHRGRADDMFKVKGMWVSPIEVEHALIKHPDVSDCAVVEYKDSRNFSQVKAYIVLNSDVSINDKDSEFKEFLNGDLPPYQIPSLFETLSEMPLTSTGKKRRCQLRDLTTQ